MLTQAEKGVAFEALHKRDGTFIIPNPWDAGTARLLAHLGFEALATTSAGYAFSVGKADNAVGRDGTLAHATAVAAATDLPLSIDLENGFGDAPASVAETIRSAMATGAVGGSIEDSITCSLWRSIAWIMNSTVSVVPHARSGSLRRQYGPAGNCTGFISTPRLQSPMDIGPSDSRSKVTSSLITSSSSRASG